ncbi:MAG: hypothetical protein C5S48_06115 [Candidatus Methanogaster sp.]|nr:MAG: hypothetical protein C5S48_06115 [ANME-2 cluster archaeon]
MHVKKVGFGYVVTRSLDSCFERRGDFGIAEKCGKIVKKCGAGGRLLDWNTIPKVKQHPAATHSTPQHFSSCIWSRLTSAVYADPVFESL